MELYRISETDRFFSTPNIDSSIIVQTLETDINVVKDLTYINGVSISKGGETLSVSKYSTLNPDPSTDNIRYFHIHFDSSVFVNIDVSYGGTIQGNIVYYPSTHAVYALQNYDKPDKLTGNDTTYELLRVNPKLTGNIKVVVDSSSNMYLDTFKVSTGLSQSQYRHIPINPDEYYGTTLMKHVKSMPSDDLYKIEDGCYELFAPASDLGNQYYDTYNSGVRTNNDEMYSENFAMLAPLCVKKNIPDFFLIFKIDGYDSLDSSNLVRMDYFLRNATLIKSFDLRSDSNIGKYIRQIYEKSKEFVGDVFVGYDYDSYNTYNAISLDRGVVSKIYESTSQERALKNQVAMNDWYTLGFQRNHVVSKDIINLEFMFDDPDASMFSLHTYFGFYVRLNGVDGGFSVTGKRTVDASTFFTFDKTVKGSQDSSNIFNPASYTNYIYGYSTQDSFVRTFNNVINVKTGDDISAYYLKPGECISNPSVEEPLGENESFCSVKLNDVANPGEHYRIIDGTNKKIFEVLISNHTSDSSISEIERSEHSYIIGSSTYKFDITRCSVFNNNYRNNIDDASKPDIIKEQISSIALAFNAMNVDSSLISAYNNGTDCFSVIYHSKTSSTIKLFEGGLEQTICMEKVDSACGFTGVQDTYINSDEYEDNSTSFFGIDGITSFVIKLTDSSTKALYYPVGFEHFGTRRASAVKFIPTTVLSGGSPTSVLYNIDEDITEVVGSIDTTLYKNDGSSENEYSVFNTPNQTLRVKVYYYDPSASDTKMLTKLCVPGYGNGEHYVVRTSEYACTTNDKLYIYKSYVLNAGLCSIFPVKDFNFNVLDTMSNFTLNDNDPDITISNTPGEYQSKDNVFGSAIASGTEESLCNYIDKYQLYDLNGNRYVPQSELSNYLYNLNGNNHKKSDISLISPYCCKWQLVGTDHRGLPMRVMFSFSDAENTTSTLISGSSYYIPDASDSYIGYATLSEEVINGDISTFSDSSTENIMAKYVGDLLVMDEYPTYRDYVLNGEGHLDDMLCGEKDRKNKWSKAYAYGNDSLEFVSGGLKIRITSNNKSIVNVADYNGYSAALICMAGSNPLHEEPCELIIDETKKQLLYIIYNGTNVDIMTYNEKNKIYNTTGIPHHNAISDCDFKYINGFKRLVVSDDAKFYNDTSLYYGRGFFVMSSPQKNFDEYTAEKYVLVYGEIKQSSVYVTQDTENLYIGNTGSDLKILVDSSLCTTTNYSLKNLCDKYNNNVDVMIFSTGTADSSTRTTGKPYTLDAIQNIIDLTAIQIKTAHGTKDLTGIDNLLKTTIVEPYSITREDTDYETVTTGEVYSGFAEPVMTDIVEFDYQSDSSINLMFQTLFNGCNLTISKVNNIYQTWLRKVIVPSTKLRTTDTSNYITHSDTTTITINLTELAYSEVKEIPDLTEIYSQVHDSSRSNFKIAGSSFDTYTEYTVGIAPNQLTKKPAVGEYWRGYDVEDGDERGIYYVKDVSSVTGPDASNFYGGTFDILVKPGEAPTKEERGLATSQMKYIDTQYQFISPRLTMSIDTSYDTVEFDYDGLAVGDKYKYTDSSGNEIEFKIVSFDLEEETSYTFTVSRDASEGDPAGPYASVTYYMMRASPSINKLQATEDHDSSLREGEELTFVTDGTPIQTFPYTDEWTLHLTVDSVFSGLKYIYVYPSVDDYTIKGSGKIVIETLYIKSQNVYLPPKGQLTKVEGDGPETIPYGSILNDAYSYIVLNDIYVMTDDASQYAFIFSSKGDKMRGNYLKFIGRPTSGTTINHELSNIGNFQKGMWDSTTGSYVPNPLYPKIYYNRSTTIEAATNAFDVTTVTDGSTFYHGGTLFVTPQEDEYYLDSTDSSIYVYESGSAIDASKSFQYSSYSTDYDSSTTSYTSRKEKMTSSISLIHNISPMKNCWHTDMYRIYTDYDDYRYENGISSGYEKNLFFASRGLTLKERVGDILSRKIVQTEWRDFVLDEINYVVKIDLTTTLTNRILISDGYASNWNNVSSTSATDKTKTNYIENSILKYIKINNATKVKVYREINSETFGFSSLDEDDMKKYSEEINITATLSNENDRYYMTLSDLGKYQYSAKITFND